MADQTSRIADWIKRTLVGDHGVDPERIAPLAMLAEDLGLDSLDCIELVVSAEVEFGIDVPEDEADRCHAVRDVQALIERLMPQPEADHG